MSSWARLPCHSWNQPLSTVGTNGMNSQDLMLSSSKFLASKQCCSLLKFKLATMTKSRIFSVLSPFNMHLWWQCWKAQDYLLVMEISCWPPSFIVHLLICELHYSSLNLQALSSSRISSYFPDFLPFLLHSTKCHMKPFHCSILQSFFHALKHTEKLQVSKHIYHGNTQCTPKKAVASDYSADYHMT